MHQISSPMAVPKPKSYHINRMNKWKNQQDEQRNVWKNNTKIKESIFEETMTFDPTIIKFSRSAYHLKGHLLRSKWSTSFTVTTIRKLDCQFGKHYYKHQCKSDRTHLQGSSCQMHIIVCTITLFTEFQVESAHLGSRSLKVKKKEKLASPYLVENLLSIIYFCQRKKLNTPRTKLEDMPNGYISSLLKEFMS